MAYVILIREDNTYREDPKDPARFWYLETYSTDDDRPITLALTRYRGMQLIQVLTFLENKDGWKMVGQDGPDRFILNKS